MRKVTIHDLRTALELNFLSNPKCLQCGKKKPLSQLKSYKHFIHVCDDCIEELKYSDSFMKEWRGGEDVGVNWK